MEKLFEIGAFFHVESLFIEYDIKESLDHFDSIFY